MLTTSPKETFAFGKSVASGLQKGDVLALVGPLGAGKTQFVKGIAAGLNLHDAEITSPTFTILQEYHDAKAPLSLYHFDFYRLESLPEVEALGIEEIFESNGVVIIEWADKFPELLPAHTQWWKFELGEGDERKIERI